MRIGAGRIGPDAFVPDWSERGVVHTVRDEEWREGTDADGSRLERRWKGGGEAYYSCKTADACPMSDDKLDSVPARGRRSEGPTDPECPHSEYPDGISAGSEASASPG